MALIAPGRDAGESGKAPTMGRACRDALASQSPGSPRKHGHQRTAGTRQARQPVIRAVDSSAFFHHGLCSNNTATSPGAGEVKWGHVVLRSWSLCGIEMVRGGGIEPPRATCPQAPQTCASTNSATLAQRSRIRFRGKYRSSLELATHYLATEFRLRLRRHLQVQPLPR